METDRNIDALNQREKGILRHVVYNYIQTATPVGSRYISKHFESHLSPATIRNVMADLEERGFLSHPHTSAGRVPTDQGYRYYVDFLMEVQNLTEPEKQAIKDQLGSTPDPNELLRETSRLLSKISRQLSVVSSPHLSSGVFEKLELVPISSSRLLVILSIRAGLVRTIMLEVGFEVRREALDRIASLLNERITGLTLLEIRETFVERVKDVRGDDPTGLVRLFIESIDQLFSDDREDRLHISGTNTLIEQPEFVDPAHFRSVIELIENEDFIVHLLEKHDDKDGSYVITIGDENKEPSASEYSIVSANYSMNGVTGKVGIIGPKRMNYSKVIPLVDHVARAIARLLNA